MLLVGLGALVIATGGCGGSGSEVPSQTGVHTASGCPANVTTTGSDAFVAAADRAAAGDVMSPDDLQALVERPVWTLWRRSYEPEIASPEAAALTVFAGLRGLQALSPAQTVKVTRRDLMSCYAFDMQKRVAITKFLTAYVRDDASCAVWSLMRQWIQPTNLPDTLRIDFLPMKAEIRRYEGHFLVDPGLAIVSGRDQLTHMLTSVLYRAVEAVPGPRGDAVEGPDAVAQTFRVLRNEGVAAYIDDLPHLFFGREHPLLRNAAPVPEDICDQATRSLVYVDDALAHILAADEPAPDYRPVFRYFIGAQSWQPTGWFMAAVIRDRQNEARLQQASRTVADFVDAYQTAALAESPSPPAPHGTAAYTVQHAPAFAPDVYVFIRSTLRADLPN